MKSNSGRTSPERHQISGENQKSIFAKQAQLQQIQQPITLEPGRRSLTLKKNNSEQTQQQDILQQLQKQVDETQIDKLDCLLISLLYKYIALEEVQQFVCEKLAENKSNRSENYILELVYLMIKYDSECLEKLLLFKSSQSIPIYLLIKWTYEAFTDSVRGNIKVPILKKGLSFQKIDAMDLKIEESMVNSHNAQANMEENLSAFLDKEHRSNYGDSIHIFVKSLVQISLTLKIIPAEERNFQLRKFLIKANRSLVSYRLNNPGVIYFQGIVLPFPIGQEGDPTIFSNMVVRIIERECCSFRTKKRVPYKILVETIDIQELKSSIPSLVRKTSDYDQSPLDDDSFKLNGSQNLNKQILEDFMVQSSKDKAAIQQMTKQNMKRFNLLFIPLKLKRRNSCSGRMQTYFLNKKLNCHFEYELYAFNKLNGHRQKHKTMKDLTIKSKIKFIQSMQLKYPQKSPIFTNIFISLGYDKQEIILELEKDKHKQLKLERQRYQIYTDGVKLPLQDIWTETAAQLREQSPYGHFNSYKLRPLIVKGGDDLRQELMVMQLLKICENIFNAEGTGLYLRTYEIMVTSVDSGIIEFCVETMSIDALKKRMVNFKGLNAIYRELFSDSFEEAQKCFIDSLAAYSVVQYLFQIKDRHNGNILVDRQGHLIHIDFGFILSVSPGGINFENVPFKLTKEYVELMDGKNSDMFQYFKNRVFQGFSALKKNVSQFLQIINIMKHESELPCFEKFDLKVFVDRFMENVADEDLMIQVEKIINLSLENSRTVLYDNFQKLTNGIMP